MWQADDLGHSLGFRADVKVSTMTEYLGWDWPSKVCGVIRFHYRDRHTRSGVVLTRDKNFRRLPVGIAPFIF